MFNETKGGEIYLQISKKKDLSAVVDRQYVSFAALNCLYSYFTEGDEFFLDVSKLRIEHYQMKDCVIVTNDAARNLELLVNNVDKKSKSCLFSIFSCLTYGGGNC